MGTDCTVGVSMALGGVRGALGEAPSPVRQGRKLPEKGRGRRTRELGRSSFRAFGYCRDRAARLCTSGSALRCVTALVDVQSL